MMRHVAIALVSVGALIAAAPLQPTTLAPPAPKARAAKLGPPRPPCTNCPPKVWIIECWFAPLATNQTGILQRSRTPNGPWTNVLVTTVSPDGWVTNRWLIEGSSNCFFHTCVSNRVSQ